MTTALTAFVYTSALSAGLLLGSTTRQLAALLVALILVARLAVRRHRAVADRRATAETPAQPPAPAPTSLRTTVGGVS